MNQETALVLRVCKSDMTSHHGFVWPSEIGEEVVAPDWIENDKCGNGLHGWLYGQGELTCVDHWRDVKAKWLVLEVALSDVVMLGGKCKFPRAVVRFVGCRSEAAAYIVANDPFSADFAVIGATKYAGINKVAIVGALGHATAGDYGTATAGYKGTATAGGSGTAIAGDLGTATTGYSGTATAGDYGTAIAGYKGTAIAGGYGTAIAGHKGTATAGYKGELRIKWYDKKADRYRTAQAYVGENGIKANTPYKLNDENEFMEVTK